VIFVGGLGRGRGRQHLPRTLVKSMRSQLATLVRGSSVTAHCLAATALLTREYQGDHRRQDLISAASRATYPLTSPSISDFGTVRPRVQIPGPRPKLWSSDPNIWPGRHHTLPNAVGWA
jgi:hypothetical protein